MYLFAMRFVALVGLREVRIFCLVLVAIAVAWRSFGSDLPGLPPGVVNTQDPKDKPLPPEEARRRMTVPEGFTVSLFAGEPNVMQPIAFDFDDRGRIVGHRVYAADAGVHYAPGTEFPRAGGLHVQRTRRLLHYRFLTFAL